MKVPWRSLKLSLGREAVLRTAAGWVDPMGTLRFGTSGWDYEEWLGGFYRSSTESKLAAYSRVFKTAEINSSFYRPPTKGMVMGWIRYSPDDFVFAAKVPQTVTHDRRLDVAKRAEDDLRSFCELMDPLNDSGKLGPLLLQLPPSLRFDLEGVRKFFEILPHRFKWAIEFRHRSWLVPDAYDLLREHGVAYTIVDEPLLPPDVHVTAPFAYVRWHGHGRDPWYDYRYAEDQLKEWAPKVEKIAEAADPVYGFFNNHYHGYAPENCLQILEMLGVITPEQREMKRQIEDFREGVTRVAGAKVRATSLDTFAEEPVPSTDPQVAEALQRFMDRGRLDRAKRFPEGDIELEVDGDEVQARIKGYRVLIDFGAKRILHDCEDWSSRVARREFCKHVGKVFLAMKPSVALERLDTMRGERSAWRFDVPEP